MKACASATLALALLGCSPMKIPPDPFEQDAGPEQGQEDFSRRFLDMSEPCPAAEVPYNLLSNSSFEMGAPGSAIARNTGMPMSTIPSWDGCCNSMGQGLTTTWEITDSMPHCGKQAVRVRSVMARVPGDVLNQELTIAGAADRSFLFTAWVSIDQADAGASLVVDLFDLRRSAVIAASPALGGTSQGFTQLIAMGRLPASTMGEDPRVQARLRTEGTLTARADDLALIVR